MPITLAHWKTKLLFSTLHNTRIILVTGSHHLSRMWHRVWHGEAPASVSWLTEWCMTGSSLGPDTGLGISRPLRVRSGPGRERTRIDTDTWHLVEILCGIWIVQTSILKYHHQYNFPIIPPPTEEELRAELWVGISVHKTRIWIFGKQF